MSGGVLALVIASVVVLCCIGPVALCVVSGAIGSLIPVPTTSP